MAAIEKGAEVPPLPETFFADNGRVPASPRRQLLTGLIWLFLGLALLIALRANGLGNNALYGLIPMAIGLAHLLFYFAVGRHEAEAAEKAKLAETNQKFGG